jgi:hypothetical protein
LGYLLYSDLCGVEGVWGVENMFENGDETDEGD